MENKIKKIIRRILIFIFNQLNKLARNPWITPRYGDVAKVFGEGPCERCVGRMVSTSYFGSDYPFNDKNGHVEALTNLEWLELQDNRRK